MVNSDDEGSNDRYFLGDQEVGEVLSDESVVESVDDAAPSRKRKAVASSSDEEVDRPVRKYVEKILNYSLDSAVQIPEKIRNAIADKKYVDLALLCGKEKRSSLSFDEWSSAFSIYGIIFGAEYPDEAFLLFHYLSIIKEAHSISPSWYDYDVSFRKKMEMAHQNPGLNLADPPSWAKLDVGLHQKYVLAPCVAAASSRRLPSTSGAGVSGISHQNRFNVSLQNKFNKIQYTPSNPYNRGWCMDFNLAQQGCVRKKCPWKHECPICKIVSCKERTCPRVRR